EQQLDERPVERDCDRPEPAGWSAPAQRADPVDRAGLAHFTAGGCGAVLVPHPHRHRYGERVRITTDALAPRPTVWPSATRAPSTCRDPACPCNCATSSTAGP